ncbi:SUKH-4 family immunity protein [Deinococcus cellulosilyticus]|uniref:Uncharacterized protein n=1 Tax=Deinococcus cellulosilyticus (strain DSM 18568 / NBRC 106333 / KACC 11606 / 5516J-15) TaxID=1223518 RepID=A0A511MYD6_DEIC1|nr:SUKH-4 family immunity protein [Deinococcus cellulosilyticus]GEM45583.1 hypothetical protein DC3_12180 [Deinococcus cellulosilyticus NBRC 106333 = KACC 11606]
MKGFRFTLPSPQPVPEPPASTWVERIQGHYGSKLRPVPLPQLPLEEGTRRFLEHPGLPAPMFGNGPFGVFVLHDPFVRTFRQQTLLVLGQVFTGGQLVVHLQDGHISVLKHNTLLFLNTHLQHFVVFHLLYERLHVHAPLDVRVPFEVQLQIRAERLERQFSEVDRPALTGQHGWRRCLQGVLETSEEA